MGGISLRIDWLSPDVPATVARLRRLGLTVVEVSGAPGPVLDLAGAPIDILAAPPGERDERLGGLADRPPESTAIAAGPHTPDPYGAARLAAIGLATVDAQRAAADLVRVPSVDLVDAGPDDALGARAYHRPEAQDADGPPVLFLEPAREGPLAAALARFGEGPVALYVAGVSGTSQEHLLRAPAATPVGPARLARPEKPWGPFVLLLEPARRDG